MEILERIWEMIGLVFGGLLKGVERGVTSLFGSSNARYLRRLQPTVEAINSLEPKYQAMTDAELREQTAKFRERLAAGETLDDLLIEAFAVCREARPPVLGHAAFRRAADRRHGAAPRARSPRWSPAKARRWWPRCRPT